MQTHLYIKTHNITGLKYFGKTCRDPFKYKGSGKYWKRHLKIHGNDVTTVIYGSYDTIEDCTMEALEFSILHNIVESNEWANLIEENGLDGMPVGHSACKNHRKETKAILSRKSKEMWGDSEFKENMKHIHKKSWTDERKNAQSERLIGVARPEHSEKMKEIRNTPEAKAAASKFFSELERTEEHCKKIANSLKGKSKSDEHRSNLSLSRKNAPTCCRISDRKEIKATHINREPIARCCRLSDHKEMSIANFKKYDK